MTQARNRITRSLGVLVVVLLSSLTTAQANADLYQHIDVLALRIQRTARKLLNETVHYRHTPEYRHLVADTQDILRLSTHIHDVTHFEGNLRHLEVDLAELDRQFHHLEAVFDRIEHNAAFGQGHIHGNTAHVKRLLNSIEGNIHHIQDDVRSLNRALVVQRPVYTRPTLAQPGCIYPRVAPPVQVQRPPYSGYGGHIPTGRGHGSRGHAERGHGSRGHGGQALTNQARGISFGSGSSRINFRF